MINMGDKDITISKPGPLSKIEKGGEQVMNHLMELARTTTLGYSGMARRLNEIYGLDITDVNISTFLRQSKKMVDEFIDSKKELADIRLRLALDHREKLVLCGNKLENEIERLTGKKEDGSDKELLEPDKRANAVANLVDKFRRLLLSKARLSGEISDNRGGGTKIDNMQVNIISDKRSEIMRRLKTFDPKKIIDVEAKDEDKSPNN